MSLRQRLILLRNEGVSRVIKLGQRNIWEADLRVVRERKNSDVKTAHLDPKLDITLSHAGNET